MKVLYLYDNKLETAETLWYASNLTHVYLMNNKLTTTRGFSKLRKLEKLYLANNRIEVIEDLILNPLDQDYEPKLKELHIENQILPKGHSLIFDPQCLSYLAYSLQVLNISNNNIKSVENILETCHKSLDKFYASSNNIKTLSINEKITFPYLQVVHLKNNPIQKKLGSKKYRQTLVVKFSSLKDLDDNEISNFERKWHESFSQQMAKRKAAAAANAQSRSEEAVSGYPSESVLEQQLRAASQHSNTHTNMGLLPENKEESMINFESSENLLQQKISSMSTTDIAPPVPEHWRKKGLPGGRNQFDKILEKARLQAHERILKQTSQKQYNLAEANRKLSETNASNDFGLGDAIVNQKKGLVDFQSRVQGGEIVNEVNDLPDRKINLSAMRLAPIDDFSNMQGDN